jgi:hypothetical protein
MLQCADMLLQLPSLVTGGGCIRPQRQQLMLHLKRLQSATYTQHPGKADFAFRHPSSLTYTHARYAYNTFTAMHTCPEPAHVSADGIRLNSSNKEASKHASKAASF